MARTFFPEKFIDVPASPPHPPNTLYRVSIGSEQWGDVFTQVIKIQMVYDGVVSGRKSPSYPVGSNDFELVNSAVKDIL
jgi:hypothetical protein